jgi:hypothetical protein
MKKFQTAVVLLFVSLILFHCGKVTEKGTLTDEKVTQYIKAYKSLREKAPGMLEKFNKNGESVQAGQDGFVDFESAIKESGLSSYAEFVMLNAKIGTVFGIIQGTKGMDQFKDMYAKGMTAMDEGRKTLQKQLDDPNVPEGSKAELRKSLEELNQAQQNVKQDYSKNMKWGNFVMDNVKKLSGLVVNESDVEMVRKHETEIFEAYTGFPPPEGLDVNFKAINMD